MCGRRNSADELVAILDVQVPRFVMLARGDFPAEDLAVEGSGGILIGRAQVPPAERSRHIRNSDSLIGFLLPDTELESTEFWAIRPTWVPWSASLTGSARYSDRATGQSDV